MNNIVKTCTKCGEVKPLDGFRKRKIGEDRLRGECKFCQMAGLTAYQKANPEKFRAKNAAYQKANQEKIKEYRVAQRKANPEKFRAKNAAYRKSNPEKIKAKDSAYREALSDALIKKMIIKITRLPRKLIPQELIQAKRVHLQLTRKLKELRA